MTFIVCNHTSQPFKHQWFLSKSLQLILKILWKRGEIAPKEQFLLFFTIFYSLQSLYIHHVLIVIMTYTVNKKKNP